MKIIFFGTPEFAADILRFLIEEKASIAGVVTQPDKGRNTPHVKKAAQSLIAHVPLFQPEKASDPLFIEEMRSLNPDLFIVVAYGQILKQKLLDVPNIDAVNIHASLLPAYRGAAPMRRSLMNGDSETGITIMRMVLKMDAGEIIDQARLLIDDEINYAELEKKMAELAKPLLLKTIFDYQNHRVTWKCQDESKVTFAPKILPEELKICWNRPAKEIHNLIRALSFKPGAYTEVFLRGEKKRLKILKSRPVDLQRAVKTITQKKDRLIISCLKDSLEILFVQLEGKKIISIKDFLSGLKEPLQIL